MKDIIKVIKFLENRGILLKGTTRKILIKKGDFSTFYRPLDQGNWFIINEKCTHTIS